MAGKPHLETFVKILFHPPAAKRSVTIRLCPTGSVTELPWTESDWSGIGRSRMSVSSTRIGWSKSIRACVSSPVSLVKAQNIAVPVFAAFQGGDNQVAFAANVCNRK